MKHSLKVQSQLFFSFQNKCISCGILSIIEMSLALLTKAKHTLHKSVLDMYSCTYITEYGKKTHKKLPHSDNVAKGSLAVLILLSPKCCVLAYQVKQPLLKVILKKKKNKGETLKCGFE